MNEIEPQAHRVTWFAPDRPVEGNTINARTERGHSVNETENADQLAELERAVRAFGDVMVATMTAMQESAERVGQIMGEIIVSLGRRP